MEHEQLIGITGTGSTSVPGTLKLWQMIIGITTFTIAASGNTVNYNLQIYKP